MVVPWDNSLRAGVERCDVMYLAAENDVCVVICVYIHTRKLKIYHGDTFSLSEDFVSH